MKYQITLVLACDGLNDDSINPAETASVIAATACRGAIEALKADRKPVRVEAFCDFNGRVEAPKSE